MSPALSSTALNLGLTRGLLFSSSKAGRMSRYGAGSRRTLGFPQPSQLAGGWCLQIFMVENAGHHLLWDNAPAFNAYFTQLASSLAPVTSAENDINMAAFTFI